MDFTLYTIEDFLTNESFLSYCLDIDGKDRIFWENWIIEHPDRKDEVEKATALFFTLSGDWNPKQFDINFKSFQSTIQKRINDKQLDTGRRKRSSKKIIQYAISAIVSMSTLWSLSRNTEWYGAACFNVIKVQTVMISFPCFQSIKKQLL